jgi:hypothetical protein
MAGRLRLLAAAALVSGPLVIAAAPASADSLFQGQTAATAVHVTITQQPASSIITASLIDDAFAYAASAYDSSGGSEALASSVYPGKLVVEGPALFCSEVFTCPAAPPNYPLLADASYPRATDAHADANQQPLGSGPFVVTPADATAQASATGNSGQTAAGRISLLAGTPVAVTVGASTASTKLVSTVGSITEQVASDVADVTIGGLVHIGSVATTDNITVKPGSKPTNTPHVVVTGVSVAGQPASIDESGLHVAGQNGPELGRQLAAQGIAIRTVGTTKTDAPDAARSDATGLEVDFTLPVSGTPYIPNPLPSPFDVIPGVNANGNYVGRITLGAVGAVSATELQPSFDLGGFPLTNAIPSTPSGAVTAPATSTGDLLQQLATAPPAAPQLPARSTLHAVLEAFSLSDLYAALALGTVGLFLGWRLLPLIRRTRSAART